MKISAYFLAIQDDLCLSESIISLKQQGVSDVVILSPDRYWTTGQLQAASDLCALETIARETGSTLHRVCQSDLQVEESEENFRPLYVEAAYRNLALDMCAGSDAVLTVDADEFWADGLVAHVKDLVQSAGNTASRVFLPMTPVVAGFPVRGATDRALVATTQGTRFTWGRAATGSEIAGSLPVIHFSLTRRTQDEVVEKCRRSAHYPDPTYDFDGWITRVLPSVHAGMRDLHMYCGAVNIWPVAGTWAVDEIASLPETLHKHLKT